MKWLYKRVNLTKEPALIVTRSKLTDNLCVVVISGFEGEYIVSEQTLENIKAGNLKEFVGKRYMYGIERLWEQKGTTYTDKTKLTDHYAEVGLFSDAPARSTYRTYFVEGAYKFISSNASFNIKVKRTLTHKTEVNPFIKDTHDLKIIGDNEEVLYNYFADGTEVSEDQYDRIKAKQNV